jgi:hypothetical protein
MKSVQLFLSLLAERVYTARTSTGPLRDASDFREWLTEAADLAGSCNSMEEFFRRLS